MNFGRLADPDPLDHNYPIRAFLAPAPPTRIRRWWWANGAWLNQGNSGTCVGHGWAHWIEDGPRTWPGTADPYDIYKQCCVRDAWAENDNGDLSFGTSVRAGAQVMVEMGKAVEYRWAFNAQEVVDAILTIGPVVLGTNWYRGMSSPVEGFIAPTGVLDGGHCYVGNGVDIREEYIRVKNSWGREWSSKGHAKLRFADLDRLISEEGEACIAIERRWLDQRPQIT